MKCLSVCLKVQHIQAKEKNANNAHKYDCSSPKERKKMNKQQQEKKSKKMVNVT